MQSAKGDQLLTLQISARGRALLQMPVSACSTALGYPWLLALVSRWVGADFADTARAMHAGDAPPELVHGSATLDQAKSLVQEGVPVAPLPLPVVPPAQVN